MTQGPQDPNAQPWQQQPPPQPWPPQQQPQPPAGATQMWQAQQPPGNQAPPQGYPPPPQGYPPPPQGYPPPPQGYPPPPQGYQQQPGYPPPGYGPSGYPQPYGAVAPYQQGGVGNTGPLGKVVSPGITILWVILSLGIYTLFFHYRVNREMRDRDPRIQVKPGVAVLAIIPGCFILVPPLVTIYNTVGRAAQLQQDEGLQPTASPILGLLLAIVVGFLFPFYVQSELNKVWRARGAQ